MRTPVMELEILIIMDIFVVGTGHALSRAKCVAVDVTIASITTSYPIH